MPDDVNNMGMAAPVGSSPATTATEGVSPQPAGPGWAEAATALQDKLSGAGPSSSEAPQPISTPPVSSDEFADLGEFGKHPRFQQLLHERNALKEQAQNWSTYGITPEQGYDALQGLQRFEQVITREPDRFLSVLQKDPALYQLYEQRIIDAYLARNEAGPPPGPQGAPPAGPPDALGQYTQQLLTPLQQQMAAMQKQLLDVNQRFVTADQLQQQQAAQGYWNQIKAGWDKTLDGLFQSSGIKDNFVQDVIARHVSDLLQKDTRSLELLARGNYAPLEMAFRKLSPEYTSRLVNAAAAPIARTQTLTVGQPGPGSAQAPAGNGAPRTWDEARAEIARRLK